MAISKANQKKAKTNKQLFLTGKPFLIPSNLDIHRHPFQVHLGKDEVIDPDPKHTFVTQLGWGSEHFRGNATGRLWVYFTKDFFGKKLSIRVAFHQLDFDITIDGGDAYKEINGEKVKQEYRSQFTR